MTAVGREAEKSGVMEALGIANTEDGIAEAIKTKHEGIV